MALQLTQYGNRTPKLNRVLLTGSALTGKTVTAAKFASSPDRALFISTDGNAIRQGYKGIHFEFPTNATAMLPTMIEALNIAQRESENWDALIIDLTEDFDERLQTLLRSDLETNKTALKAWGKITAFYKDLQSLLMTRFSDKIVVLLSREIAIETKDKWGNVIAINYVPALRETLRNQLLKDQDAEIRLYFDDKGNRQVDAGKQRYPEITEQLWQILQKPLPDFYAQPEAPVELTPEQLTKKLTKLIINAEKKASETLNIDSVIPYALKGMIMASTTFDQGKTLVGKWAADQGL